ncbi:MAG: hypothetical protein R3360_06595, partial [Alphaproteobacteria bacterium]|nr:hypothetical protein [Alphaproteobacteria bacterium]
MPRLLAALLVAFSWSALTLEARAQEPVRDYRSCIVRANTSPSQALEAARQWRDFGGGLAAEHCMAVALVRQGAYERGAQLLEAMANRLALTPGQDRMEMMTGNERAQILAQAGNAWLLAERFERAYRVFSTALAENGLNRATRSEILIDRARAQAELNDFLATIEDLNAALATGGERADIYVLRAAAHRSLEEYSRAEKDIETALNLDPGNADALLERGNLRWDRGEQVAAMED